MNGVVVKELSKTANEEEIQRALSLCKRVFMQYEAPDYTQEGVEEFCKSIGDDDYLSKLRIYGAYIKNELVGVIATRNKGKHIALFFVEGKYHRQGIGKQLFCAVRTECMTVNSSPYAVPVYRRLGFKETDSEQNVNGLRFTPMKMK